jgi:Pyridoxamine 5'-phosphate oxidase
MTLVVLPEHDLLPTNGSAVLFMIVRRSDGGPTAYPMTGLFRDSTLEITTYRKSAKARFLLADDRVCCVLPDPDHLEHGLALYGRATPAPVDEFARSTTSRTEATMHVPDEVVATVRDRLASQKRMVFRIDVERWHELGGATS